MNTSSKKHVGYYVSLGAILLLGFTLIVVTRNIPDIQMMVILMTTFFYVLWGIVHHVMHHDITPKIVIEYVLIGVLGVVLGLLLVR
jgi:hypothetical protein